MLWKARLLGGVDHFIVDGLCHSNAVSHTITYTLYPHANGNTRSDDYPHMDARTDATSTATCGVRHRATLRQPVYPFTIRQ